MCVVWYRLRKNTIILYSIHYLCVYVQSEWVSFIVSSHSCVSWHAIFHSIRCCLPLSNSIYGCYLLYTFVSNIFFGVCVFFSCMKQVLHNHNHRPLWGICIIIQTSVRIHYTMANPHRESLRIFFALFLHWNLSNDWSDRVASQTIHWSNSLKWENR